MNHVRSTLPHRVFHLPDTVWDVPCLCNHAGTIHEYESFWTSNFEDDIGTEDLLTLVAQRSQCSIWFGLLRAIHADCRFHYGCQTHATAVFVWKRFVRFDGKRLDSTGLETFVSSHISPKRMLVAQNYDNEPRIRIGNKDRPSISHFGQSLFEAVDKAVWIMRFRITPFVISEEKKGCFLPPAIYKVFLSIELLLEVIYENINNLPTYYGRRRFDVPLLHFSPCIHFTQRTLGASRALSITREQFVARMIDVPDFRFTPGWERRCGVKELLAIHGLANVELPTGSPLTREDLISSLLKRLKEPVFWCPSLSKRLRLTALETVKLFSLLPEPCSSATNSHTNCTNDYCKEFNRGRTTKHQAHCLECGPLQEINQRRLIAIIRSGKIPLISSSCDLSGRASVKLVAATTQSRYTAISHVWSGGGLGNKDDNGLPQCQLDWLHSIIEASPGRPELREPIAPSMCERLVDTVWQRRGSSETKLYWLDTLCVPVNSDSDRRLAIDTMATIYAQACEVLVLDPELQKRAAQDYDPQDLGRLVKSSPWMARSWTLQEGAFAVNLRLRFADRDVSWYSLAQLDRSLSTLGMQRIFEQEVIGFGGPTDRDSPATIIKKVAKMYVGELEDGLRTPKRREDKSAQFIALYNILSSRSTSEAEDVVNIFAALLHFNVEKILRLDEHQRFRALLRSHKYLPVHLLFAPGQDTGHRWVPKVPQCSNEVYQLDPTLGIMTWIDEGLSVPKATNLLIYRGEITSQRTLDLHDTRGKRYVRVHLPEVHSKQIESKGNTYLFWLTNIQRSTVGLFEGLCLDMIANDTSKIHVSMRGRVEWEKLPAGAFHSDERPIPVESRNVSATSPMIVRLDQNLWSNPQQSRLEVQPFALIDFSQDQFLDLLPVLNKYICWQFVLMGTSLDLLVGTERWTAFETKYLWYWLVVAATTGLSLFLTPWEFYIIRQYEQDWVQTNWASSLRSNLAASSNSRQDRLRCPRWQIVLVVLWAALCTASASGLFFSYSVAHSTPASMCACIALSGFTLMAALRLVLFIAYAIDLTSMPTIPSYITGVLMLSGTFATIVLIPWVLLLSLVGWIVHRWSTDTSWPAWVPIFLFVLFMINLIWTAITVGRFLARGSRSERNDRSRRIRKRRTIDGSKWLAIPDEEDRKLLHDAIY